MFDEDGGPNAKTLLAFFAVTCEFKGVVVRRTVVWLTDRQFKALTRISKQSLAPISALVRQTVNEFLEKGRKYRKPRAGQRTAVRSK